MVLLPVKYRGGFFELNPSKIVALGLNYREHIKESISIKSSGGKHDIPEEPVVFSKTPNAIIGEGEPIVLPSISRHYGFSEPRIDYEAEFALIIGKKCKNINESDVSDVILGFTCMNDVSHRDIQNSDLSGWFRGKSFDTFAPIGPCLVLYGDIGNYSDLEIKARLNGKIVQSANTGSMIFSIPQIVCFVSRNFTLYPGDIISTGTPQGVGPLHENDIIEIEIENIGVLRNKVVNESC